MSKKKAVEIDDDEPCAHGSAERLMFLGKFPNKNAALLYCGMCGEEFITKHVDYNPTI